MDIEFSPEAVLILSNHGGISIMLDPLDNEYLYYKYYKETPIRAKISYLPYDEEEEEIIPIFKTEEGLPYRLDEFMRAIY